MADNDAWRAYVELVLGLTETSRKKAMKIVQQVTGKSGVTAEQLQDLVGQGMANREALTRMIKVELDRALGRLGLATMEEVEELTRRVRDLERELQETRAAAGNHAAPAPAPAAGESAPAATATPAKKTVAKKTVAKKAPAAKATGAPPATATGTAAPAKRTAAKKTTATTTATKATAARKAPAKKTATGTGR